MTLWKHRTGNSPSHHGRVSHLGVAVASGPATIQRVSVPLSTFGEKVHVSGTVPNGGR